MIDQKSRIKSALTFLDPSDRSLWVKVAMGLKHEFGDAGLDEWDHWSQGAQNYKERDARDVWRSIKPGGRTTIASVFYEARAAGWPDDQPYREPTPEQTAIRRQHSVNAEAERLSLDTANAIESRAVWDKSTPADAAHPYLVKKGVKPHNLRQHARPLTVPLVDMDGVLWNVQRIYPDGLKLFRPGRARGLFSPIGDWTEPSTVLICEGWATGASLHEQLGHPVLCAMNAGNLLPVAQAVRERWPHADIVVAGDDDRQTEGNPGRTAATKAALAARARLVFPAFGPDESGSDFNDWLNARVSA